MRTILTLILGCCFALGGFDSEVPAEDPSGGMSLAQRIRDESTPVTQSLGRLVREAGLGHHIQPVSAQVELIPPSAQAEAAETDPPSPDALQQLRKPIHQIAVSSYLSDQPVPDDRAAQYLGASPVQIGAGMGGAILPDRYPIVMKHRPLYFEQANLERCGNACGVFQNAISAARFVAHTAVLPYRICQHRNQPCVVAGGDCKSCQCIDECNLQSCCPLDAKSLATEAAALAGFSFLLL